MALTADKLTQEKLMISGHILNFWEVNYAGLVKNNICNQVLVLSLLNHQPVLFQLQTVSYILEFKGV